MISILNHKRDSIELNVEVKFYFCQDQPIEELNPIFNFNTGYYYQMKLILSETNLFQHFYSEFGKIKIKCNKIKGTNHFNPHKVKHTKKLTYNQNNANFFYQFENSEKNLFSIVKERYPDLDVIGVYSEYITKKIRNIEISKIPVKIYVTVLGDKKIIKRKLSIKNMMDE